MVVALTFGIKIAKLKLNIFTTRLQSYFHDLTDNFNCNYWFHFAETRTRLGYPEIQKLNKITRNQYASPPRGNAIPAGHMQKRLSLNLVSLSDS